MSRPQQEDSFTQVHWHLSPVLCVLCVLKQRLYRFIPLWAFLDDGTFSYRSALYVGRRLWVIYILMGWTSFCPVGLEDGPVFCCVQSKPRLLGFLRPKRLKNKHRQITVHCRICSLLSIFYWVVFRPSIHMAIRNVHHYCYKDFLCSQKIFWSDKDSLYDLCLSE